MKTEHDDKTLTVYLAGRIDANNATEIGDAISAAIAENIGLVPAFDAGELEYISSAGLRVLLKFCKQFGKNLDVINASNEVYEIFEITGFTELLNVKKKLREISLEGCEIIGGGVFSTVYRLDPETIVKVFTRPTAALAGAEKDRIILREVFLHDIPAAIDYDVVKAGDKYGLVYKMIDTDTVSGTIRKHPERFEELSLKMARLMKKLHTTEFDTEKSLDVGDAGLGHPIIEFMCLYSLFIFLARYSAKSGSGGTHEKNMGLDAETLGAMWNIILPEYFGTSDKETLSRYEEIMSDYASIFFMEAALLSDETMPVEKRRDLCRKAVIHLSKVTDTLKPIYNI